MSVFQFVFLLLFFQVITPSNGFHDGIFKHVIILLWLFILPLATLFLLPLPLHVDPLMFPSIPTSFVSKIDLILSSLCCTHSIFQCNSSGWKTIVPGTLFFLNGIPY